MKRKNKIYCKHCKYYKTDIDMRESKCIMKAPMKNNYVTGKIVIVSDFDKNKNGDCKKYKRVWLYFWANK